MPDPTFDVLVGFAGTSLTNVSSFVTKISIDRGRAEQFGQMVSGRAIIELDNELRYFTPENAASPYYPYLDPNKVVVVQASSSYVADPGKRLFRGYIDQWNIDPEFGNRMATIQCTDNGKLLQIRRVDMPVIVNTKASSIITDILSAAGITGPNSIDALADDLPYAWFPDQEAGQAMQSVVELGLYVLYPLYGSEGFAVKDRHYQINSVSPVASYVNQFAGLRYTRGDASVINEAIVGGSGRKLWSGQGVGVGLGDKNRRIVGTWPYTVEANSYTTTGTSITNVPVGLDTALTLDYRDPDTNEPAPCASLRLYPHLLDGVTGDVVVTRLGNTSSTYNGTNDLTTQCSVWLEDFGDAGKIHIYNGGPADGMLWRARIRGLPLQRVLFATTSTQVASSVTAYGKHSFSFTSALFGLDAYPKGYGEFVAFRNCDIRPTVEMTLKNVWPDQLDRELLEILWVVESHSAVSGLWQVWGISHDIDTARGIEHVTKYTLDRWTPAGIFVLDQDHVDTGKLGF
jgi:hypothetical protein